MTLRVGYVVPYLKMHSGWRSLSTGIVDSFRASGLVEETVFVARCDFDIARALWPNGRIESLPATQAPELGVSRLARPLALTFLDLLRRRLPPLDIVHSLEAYPTGMVGHWIAGRTGARHVVTIAGTYGVIWRRSRVHRRLYGRVLRSAACLCPISAGTAGKLRASFDRALQGHALPVVLLGTSYTAKVPREVALRPRDSGHMILSVGEVKSRKGYHVSLAAFDLVRGKVPDARYVVVGNLPDNLYGREMRSAAATMRGVEFLGRTTADELESLYRQADVFLLAPQEFGDSFEGFGLVYIEAGAYGLPAVGTRVGGVPDAIRAGVTGFLREPDDIRGIADDVVRLLTDTDLARRMGTANRDWAEYLTWDRYVQTQFALYKSCLAHSSQGCRQPEKLAKAVN